jgi:hypothetical protein
MLQMRVYVVDKTHTSLFKSSSDVLSASVLFISKCIVYCTDLGSVLTVLVCFLFSIDVLGCHNSLFHIAVAFIQFFRALRISSVFYIETNSGEDIICIQQSDKRCNNAV